MAKKVAQMIEEQIHFWTRKNSTEKSFTYVGKKLPLITVSREFGARGAALASKLETRLGFKVWDKDLLEIISEKIGSSKEFIKSLDEARRGLLEDSIFGFMRQRETNLNFLLYLVKTVRTLERLGNNIIVGRGANYICQNPASFHVRIVCPLKTRIELYARRENLPKDDATELILMKDAERANFIKYNFNKDVTNSSDYDLVINSATYTLDEMADLVIASYELKTKQKTPFPKNKIII